MAKIDHLYIGTGEVKTERGQDLATGFLKMQGGACNGFVFTPAFIVRSEAEKWFGKGNYKRIEIKD